MYSHFLSISDLLESDVWFAEWMDGRNGKSGWKWAVPLLQDDPGRHQTSQAHTGWVELHTCLPAQWAHVAVAGARRRSLRARIR